MRVNPTAIAVLNIILTLINFYLMDQNTKELRHQQNWLKALTLVVGEQLPAEPRDCKMMKDGTLYGDYWVMTK